MLHWIVDRLTFSKDDIARRGERAAGRYLKSKGYRLLGYNVRTAGGEVDVLMQAPDGRTIVIVEVKSTAAGETTAGELRPEARVGTGKQRKLATLAGQLARRKAFRDRPMRFDVVGVDFSSDGKPAIRHHEAAFESFI